MYNKKVRNQEILIYHSKQVKLCQCHLKIISINQYSNKNINKSSRKIFQGLHPLESIRKRLNRRRNDSNLNFNLLISRIWIRRKYHHHSCLLNQILFNHHRLMKQDIKMSHHHQVHSTTPLINKLFNSPWLVHRKRFHPLLLIKECNQVIVIMKKHHIRLQ